MTKTLVKLEDVCEFITDGTHQTPTYCNNSGFIFLSSKDVTKQKIDWGNAKRIPDDLHKQLSARLKPRKNDILLAKNGTTGVAAIVDRDEIFDVYVSLAVLRPLATIFPKYLLYAINSPYTKHQFNAGLKGIGVPNLHLNIIRQTQIKVHNLDQQYKIVSILDQVNQIISLRTQQLEQLDLLIKSRFVEMFGDPVTNPKCWEQKRFDQICENLDSRRIPITASERVTGIYPYYGASGIIDYVSDYIFDEDILLISEDGANLLARTTPIAFSVSGKVWVNNHAHVVKFENLSLQKYIEIYFSLIDISTYITGSAQPKLNQAKLNAIMFPIPDGKVLDTFNVFYKQVEFTKATVKQSLEWLNTLKSKLMQDYFG